MGLRHDTDREEWSTVMEHLENEGPVPVPCYEEIERFSLVLRDKEGFVSAEELQETYRRELQQCEVVSFDIFDTLLIRYAEIPQDVYLHLANHPAFHVFRFPVPFINLRMQAEDASRQIAFQEKRYWEVSLLEIYECFCDRNGLSRKLAPAFVAAEEEVDLKLCVVNPVLRDLHDQAKRAGKQVIYVSDMYHSSEFLAKLLRHNGYDTAPGSIYVSSEYRISKSDGNLFRTVMKKLSVPAEKILHIGDHPDGDCKVPRKLGIRAFLHPYRAASEKRPTVTNDPHAALRSYCLGMSRVAGCDPAPEKSFWWHLGYDAYGPLTTGYCQWLNARMKEDQIGHIWFVLRDCEVIAKIYRLLFPEGNGAPKISILPLSRRAALLPVIEKIPDVALSTSSGLFSGLPMPFREYFERLQLDPTRFQNEIALCGVESLDAVVDPATCLQYKALTQPAVLQAVIDRAAVEREALVAYLRQQKLLSQQRIAMVDIGWRGSSQKAMQILLSQISPESQLKGYYLATHREFLVNNVPGMQQTSFLVNYGEPKQLLDLLLSVPSLLERFFTSNSGSLLYFQLRNGVAEPVFNARDISSHEGGHLEEMHAGAIAFAQDYQTHAPDLRFGAIPREVAIDGYLELLTHPSPEEALKVGGLHQGESMGSLQTRCLAKWPSPSMTIEEIWQVYEKSLWKMGLVRQNTPQSAALRTLLWLNECDKF
jgi:predicted HAD superfamily hydrolase